MNNDDQDNQVPVTGDLGNQSVTPHSPARPAPSQPAPTGPLEPPQPGSQPPQAMPPQQPPAQTPHADHPVHKEGFGKGLLKTVLWVVLLALIGLVLALAAIYLFKI